MRGQSRGRKQSVELGVSLIEARLERVVQSSHGESFSFQAQESHAQMLEFRNNKETPLVVAIWQLIEQVGIKRVIKGYALKQTTKSLRKKVRKRVRRMLKSGEVQWGPTVRTGRIQDSQRYLEDQDQTSSEDG
jgi:hypothetical protein